MHQLISHFFPQICKQQKLISKQPKTIRSYKYDQLILE